jgi:hypothetical protein
MRLFDNRVPSGLLLDLTIASQMRPHDALSSRLAELGLKRSILKATEKRAVEAGVVHQLRIPWMLIVDYFGEPGERGADHLTYELALWPAHQFRFGIHPQGWVTHDGFRLVSPTPVQVPELISSTEARKVFHPGHHTVAEVREAMRPPRLVQGWERMEDWYYAVGEGSRDLVLEFDFGLLTGIDQRTPILMSP